MRWFIFVYVTVMLLGLTMGAIQTTQDTALLWRNNASHTYSWN